MPSATEDHRNTHTTWDGRIAIIGVGSQYNATLTLPNGQTCNDTNLKWYRDKVATWERPVIDAVHGTPAIDGVKDDLYNNGTTALIETVTWSYEYSKPTDTNGKVNVVWDEEALYVYAEIKDNTGPFTGYALEKPGNLWRNCRRGSTAGRSDRPRCIPPSCPRCAGSWCSAPAPAARPG